MLKNFLSRWTDKINNNEKYRNILIRSITVGLLVLAIIGLNVFQSLRSTEPTASVNQQKVASATEKQKYIAENDYWLEPEESPVGSDSVPVVAATNNSGVDDSKKAEQPTAGKSEEATPAMASLSFPVILPADGDWGRGFGYSYDKTWDEYRFHDGLDMPLSIGSKVVAVFDGEVESITESKDRGTVITLKHSAKLKSVYAGLSVDKNLKAGDEIISGQAIGVICEAPLFEEADGVHLHFELWENGKAIDPMNYLN